MIQTIKEMFGMAGIVIFFAVLFTGLGFAGYMVYPMFLSLQRKAFVSSHQYVESARTEMGSLVGTYRDLECGGHVVVDKNGICRTLVMRMRSAASRIPADAVPREVRSILGGN